MNNSDDEREKEQKDKEKQARMEASLREREKEVQRTLATHLRDRDKEREQHKHDEAVQHFNALLADLVCGTTFADYIQLASLIGRFAYYGSSFLWKNFCMTTCPAVDFPVICGHACIIHKRPRQHMDTCVCAHTQTHFTQ